MKPDKQTEMADAPDGEEPTGPPPWRKTTNRGGTGLATDGSEEGLLWLVWAQEYDGQRLHTDICHLFSSSSRAMRWAEDNLCCYGCNAYVTSLRVDELEP